MTIQVEINGSWQQVTKQQVFEMAARGDIQPETMIDTDGQKIPASRIRDIVFAAKNIGDEHLDIVPSPNVVPPESNSDVMFPFIFEVKALTGGIVKLEIYENKIVMDRIGVISFALHGLKGIKTLYFSKISAVQFKKSGITGGYIQFTIPGAIESTKGWFSAHTDENSIRFGFDYDEIMSRVYNFIEAKIENEDSRNAAIALQHALGRKQQEEERERKYLNDILQKAFAFPVPTSWNTETIFLNERLWKDMELLSKEEGEFLIEKGQLSERSRKCLEELGKLSEEEKEERKNQRIKKQEAATQKSCAMGCGIFLLILLALSVLSAIVEAIGRL